jgi:hypothetical protein
MKRFEERRDPVTGQHYLAVASRGARLKDDPLLNKGTCFTRAEREELGLVGLLPPSVQTPEEQLDRAYENYLRADGDVRRYLFLAGRGTAFCRLVLRHLREWSDHPHATVARPAAMQSHLPRALGAIASGWSASELLRSPTAVPTSSSV